MRKDNPQQLFLIDENGKKLKIWKGYMEPGKKYGVNLSTRNVMYRYGGDIYFKPALENLIYKIEMCIRDRLSMYALLCRKRHLSP